MPLPETAGIVVIGGGVMGTSIAFHLAEAGVRDVVLLEQGQLGSGSTCKAAGGVRAQFSDPVNIALGMRGLDAFERFPDRPGQEIDLRQPGYLFLLSTPEEVETYEASVALQNSMGVPSRMLTAREAIELSPAVAREGLLAASFHQRDGYCSPESVVLGYATGARRHGATIRTGVTVTGMRTRGDEIIGVETDLGVIGTSTVVCAAGAWSRDIGAMAGVDLPVDPLRRQILISEPLPAGLLPLLPDIRAHDDRRGHHVLLPSRGPRPADGNVVPGRVAGLPHRLQRGLAAGPDGGDRAHERRHCWTSASHTDGWGCTR